MLKEIQNSEKLFSNVLLLLKLSYLPLKKTSEILENEIIKKY